MTPTGAALVAALAEDRFGPLPPLVLEAIGYGAGARDLPDRPNVVRVVLGTAVATSLPGSRRAAVLVAAAPGSPRSPEPMGVLDSYDWNVVHPRTGKTGMRGYAALRNVRDERPAWVWFGEGTIVVVLAAFLASPRRDRGAADEPPPQ